ncbi:Upstream stimulatory factor 1, partial [Bienertia sinuspersici]
MASQQSMNSNSSSMSKSRSKSSSMPQLLCYHNDIAPIRVIKHDGCSHWPGFNNIVKICQRTCGFFKWVDEFDEVRELQFKLFEKDTEIAELELENSLLQQKVKELKQTNLKNRDQLEEILLENSVTRERMYTTTANKKLYVFFLMSW